MAGSFGDLQAAIPKWIQDLVRPGTKPCGNPMPPRVVWGSPRFHVSSGLCLVVDIRVLGDRYYPVLSGLILRFETHFRARAPQGWV